MGRNGFVIVAFWLALTAWASSSEFPSVAATGDAFLEPPFGDFGADDDLPPDGQFDYLYVRAGLNVTVAGEFTIAAFLGGSVYAFRWYSFDVGARTIEMPLDGLEIRQFGVDGPYTVDLTVYNDTAILDTATFTTQPYTIAAFEDFDASFAGPVTDKPVDVDVPPNGLYDFLAVDVPIAITERAIYRLHVAYLMNQDAFNYTRLDPGTHTVRMLIPGFEIRRAGGAGFTIRVGLERHKFGGGGSETFHTTSPIPASSFEPDPAGLDVGPSEYGLDTDVPPDGLWDYIVVPVALIANRADDYRISAHLEGPTGGLAFQEVTTHVSPPGTVIPVQFSRVAIVGGQVDGPYTTRFGVYDGRDRPVASGVYISAPYSWTSFDPLPVTPSGPVQDEYRDLDVPPDGAADLYVARLPVTVNEEGIYSFTGVIPLSGGNPGFASNTTHLFPSGTATVELTWPAWRFGPGGPPTAPASYWGPGFSGAFTPSPPSVPLAPTPLTVADDPMTVLPDGDGDGLHDSLIVRWNVSVARGGPYAFTAQVRSVRNNYFVSHAVTHVTLSSGAAQVDLAFPGWTIYASELDGPYLVTLHWREGVAGFRSPDLTLVANYLTAYTPRVLHHAFEADRPTFGSGELSAPPTVDGALMAGEWSGATMIDLATSDPGHLAATALVANDAENLYVALDVAGDRSFDPVDAAALAFDTLTLDTMDPLADDQVGVGYSQIVSASEFRATVANDFMAEWWWIRQSVFHGAPGRENLTAATAFGPSPGEVNPHRTYEFRLPLRMLKTAPGRTIGFAVDSRETNGVADAHGPTLGWPVTRTGSDPFVLNSFARLVLAGTPPGPNEPPVVTVTNPLPLQAVRGTVTISGTGSDPDGTVLSVETAVDGGLWQTATGTTSWTYTMDTTQLTDGSHTLSARAFDGDAYSAIESVGFVTDNNLPDVTLLLPQSDAVLRASDIYTRWTASDATAGLDRIEMSLDGGPPIAISPPTNEYTFTGVPEGVHTVTAAAIDRAGNVRTASASVTLDVTPPSVTILRPGSQFLSGTIVVDWTASDATSGIDHFVVGMAPLAPAHVPATQTTHTFTNVPDGLYTISVSAIDRAANEGIAAVSIIVDATGPDLEITKPDPGATFSTRTVLVEWSANDAGVGLDHIDVSIDGTPPERFAGNVGAVEISDLSEGSHTVLVTAYDRAGNFATASVAFIVRTTGGGPAQSGAVLIFGAIIIAGVSASVAVVLFLRRGKRRAAPPAV